MPWHINKSIIDYSNIFIYIPLHLPKVVAHKKKFKYMSLAQQIYVNCVFKYNLLYIFVKLMQFELSGDDDICSNYMSFRIIGS